MILAGSTFSLLIVIDPVVIMRNDDFRGAIRKLLYKLKINLVSREVEGSERNGTMNGTTNTQQGRSQDFMEGGAGYKQRARNFFAATPTNYIT